MESKVAAGSKTETAGVMEKSKVMVGSEVEMVVGTETALPSVKICVGYEENIVT